MTRLLLTALLLALVLPASAQADWKTDRALEIAKIVWNDPSDNRVQIVTTDDALWGTAWTDPGVDWLIRVSPQTRARPFEQFCTVVLHEMGHLAGKPHSTDTRSIMYPERAFGEETKANGTIEWTGTDRRCRNRGRSFLATHGR